MSKAVRPKDLRDLSYDRFINSPITRVGRLTMPINQKNFWQRASDAFSEAMKSRLRRGLAVLLMLSLVSGGIYAVHSIGNILKPTEWYFYTTQKFGIVSELPSGKPNIMRRFITPEEPACDLTKFGSGTAPGGVVYRGLTLCNMAEISNEDFQTYNQHFREKVDGMYRDYHHEIGGKILTSLACGFLAWLFVVFSFVITNWIRSGQKS